MPRHRKFSDAYFRGKFIAHRGHIGEMSKELGISRVSVHRHLNRLELRVPYQGPRTKDPKLRSNPLYFSQRDKVYKAYRGLASISDVAASMGLNKMTVRQNLVDMVRSKFPRGDSIHIVQGLPLPKPPCLPLVKVIQEIEDRPELFDDAPKLAKITGIKESIVTAYLMEIFEIATRRAEAREKENLGPPPTLPPTEFVQHELVPPGPDDAVDLPSREPGDPTPDAVDVQRRDGLPDGNPGEDPVTGEILGNGESDGDEQEYDEP